MKGYKKSQSLELIEALVANKFATKLMDEGFIEKKIIEDFHAHPNHFWDLLDLLAKEMRDERLQDI